MKRVYIFGACRTPIGKLGGELLSISAVNLGSVVIREAIKRAGIPIKEVDHVFMGCVIQAGLGQNVARQASLLAGLSDKTTAQTVNIVCGSGLDAVNSAAHMIMIGDADIVIAGGMESMSNAPFALMNARYGYKMGSPMMNTPLIDTMVNDALWDSMNNYHMGITAENIAEKYGLRRCELDEFAICSQNKALNAISEGLFKEEIVPVIVNNGKKVLVINKDECPRPNTTKEVLSQLQPVFKPNGLLTAGNSSELSDGASAVVLISEEKARQLNLDPKIEWIGSALGGVDPAFMGIGPVVSTKKILSKLNIKIQDIDLIEINEAFASQTIVVKQELGISDEQLNVNGGAIALGHPVGASGCRILVTLINAMNQRQSNFGLATLCIGGGMGCSTVIRRNP